MTKKKIDILEDMRREKFDDIHKEKKSFGGPGIYIIGLFMVMLMILFFFPPYGAKIDPRPEKIPSVEDVFIFENEDANTETYILKTREDFADFVEPTNPIVKTTANRIVSQACTGERVCHAKAIYYFVRDNFQYISDPVNFEYVEKPADFIISGGGDCESGTLLMANLMESVGIDSQLVFIPGHAMLRIRLPEALSKYKKEFNWVYLDWTCSNCEFGNIPRQYNDARMTFLEVS